MKLPLPTIAKASLRQPLDVLIVGAGWAGLGAARHLLLDHKIHNVAILEGRQYVGGRSRTLTLHDGTTTAEVGSQWIQGAAVTSNPIYQATLDAGISFGRCADDEDWSNAVYIDDREGEEGGPKMRRLTQTEHDKLVHELYEGPEGFWDYQAKLQDEKGETDRSLRDVADEYLVTKQMKMNDLEVRAFEWMLDSFIAEEYAASPEDLSHRWWDADDDLEGGDVYLAQNEHSGYTTLIDHVAAPLLDKIHLDTKVTAVDWTQTPVVVDFVTGRGQDTRNETLLADNVIITVPLGVLKAGSIQFIPNLPPEKLEAIDKLGMGILNKCILLWDEKDSLPWPNDKEWIERIISSPSEGQQGRWTEFYNPAPLNGRPLLYAYCSGRVAQQVEDDCTDNQLIQKEVMDVLRSMFGGSVVPEPRQVLVSRWGEDEFSRGAYSFHQVGSTPEHRTVLGRSLGNRLYFAGGATHLQQFATTQGAFLSGIRAGKEIASKYVTSSR